MGGVAGVAGLRHPADDPGRGIAEDGSVPTTPTTRSATMHATVDEIPIEMQVGEIETRGIDWGGTLVRHIALPAGTDFTPLFVGLPDDRCQSPHYGYIVEGSITVQYADGTEETSRAGDLYYWPAGHTGWTDDGVVFVEFSPTEQIAPVLAHLAAQMAAAE
jgi:hypothetical protein